MKIVVTPDVNFRRIEAVAQTLGEARVRTALSRAVNHTGRKALTAVRRALVAQTSIPRPVVVAGVTPRPATRDTLSYAIVASGRRLPLKLFRPKQTSTGVTARVWGGTQDYPSAFIVASLGSHVFRRIGRPRLPITKLYGPSLADELVKDQSRAAFERVVQDLEPRVMHEMKRLLP